MKKQTLTVLTIVRNEAFRIKKMLYSIKDFADEFILVDDYSTDNTVDVVKSIIPHAKILKRKMQNQDHGYQRNYGYAHAKCDWILWLDADEVLTNKLKKEIKSAIKSKIFNGYYIPRINFLFNGLVKDKEEHLRLFKRNKGKNSHGAHSITIVEGKIGHLKTPLMHYMWVDVKHWMEKWHYYAESDAIRYIKEGRRYTKFHIFLMATLMPIRMFLYWYSKYWKYGLIGFLYSLQSASIWFLKAIYFYEYKYIKKDFYKENFNIYKKIK